MNRSLILALALSLSTASARELSNCDKAKIYLKAADCAEPFVSCDARGNIHHLFNTTMQSSVADSMRMNAARLRADGMAYQLLCNAEQEAEK